MKLLADFPFFCLRAKSDRTSCGDSLSLLMNVRNWERLDSRCLLPLRLLLVTNSS